MNNRNNNNPFKGKFPYENEPSTANDLENTEYTYSDFKFNKKTNSVNNKYKSTNHVKNENKRQSINQFELRNQLRNQNPNNHTRKKVSAETLRQAELERKARLDQIMQQGETRHPSAKQQRLTKDQIQQAIEVNNKVQSKDPNIISGKRKPLKPNYNADFGEQRKSIPHLTSPRKTSSGSGGNGNGNIKNKFLSKFSNKKNKKKKRNIKRIISIILIILLIFIVSLLSFLVFIKSTAKPLHLTVIGVDQRKGQAETEIRADSIISVNVGSKSNKILMASIPRDTYTFVPCEDAKDKITHAYVYGALNWKDKGGGIACTVDSVEGLVGKHDTDKYVKVNFQNMVGIVNAIGGIDLTPTATFKEQDSTGKKNKYSFTKGKKVHMDGEMALAYARHRKTDSDIARGLRQQEVLKAMASKVKHANFLQWPAMFTKVSSMVETNLNPKELMQIALVYATKGDVESYKFDWAGVMYYGVSYVELSQPSVDEFAKKVNELQ